MSVAEEGVIFDIKRFAVHDGPGIRTTLFFKGCPLKCAWCHNPESIDPMPIFSEKQVRMADKDFCVNELVGQRYSTGSLLKEVMKDQVFWDESGGGVTFSGGEPLLQHEFAFSLLKAFQLQDIHVTIDTSGFVAQPVFSRFIGEADLFLFDLKLIDNVRHQLYTGVSNSTILKNFKLAIENGVAVRVRIPVIPGVNFNNDDLDAFLDFLKPFSSNIQGVDLLPYHNIASHKYERFKRENSMKNVISLTKPELNEWQKRFEWLGFEVKMGG
jgi:pyruvate formate lyase activating enzyme